ncbi:MAG: hypothetical protein ACI8WM_003493 [Burkholderiaceae bacterium]|jgi:uncharacterized protein (DUF1800 family)
MSLRNFRVIIIFSALLLGACNENLAPASSSSSFGGSFGASSRLATVEVPFAVAAQPTEAQAVRFLAQASFGANSRSINQVVTSGTSAWINKQFSLPQTSHRDTLNAIKAALNADQALNEDNFFESFWKQAIEGEDQLRQRMVYALSQIFVISLQESQIGDHPILAASYLDMLGQHAFGNFRSLLEAVSLHPAMGIYLSALHNQKESATRAPDENYGREVMQLMSIGLFELNLDGSQKQRNGAPVETYTSTDISGMAKVFTGWSWAGPDKTANRFVGDYDNPEREWQPMQSYPQYHSTSAKNFLGISVPAQGAPDPEASLKTALDRLFNHPNVGPFIGRQLIQRLVTSNPSPAYVGRVAAAFSNNGEGVRGDMKAMIRAILLDPEARSDSNLSAIESGKLREPVLRLSGWMRAFEARSASGRFLIGNTDDVLGSIGQSPLRAPSVFNFYRPGYVPPNTAIANANLVAPEMQITGDTSVVGYLNTMRGAVSDGIGRNGDIKSDYATEIHLAETPEKLVDRVNLLLLANQMTPVLRTQIVAAVNSVPVPANDVTASAQARKNRVWLSVFLALASPEYLVQK